MGKIDPFGKEIHEEHILICKMVHYFLLNQFYLQQIKLQRSDGRRMEKKLKRM